MTGLHALEEAVKVRKAAEPASGESAERLDAVVVRLARDAGLTETLERHPHLGAAWLRQADHLIERAFKRADASAIEEVHATLFELYELQLCTPHSVEALNQHEPLFYSIRRRLERAWLEAEAACLAGGSTHAQGGNGPRIIRRLCEEHAATSHPLFDFLAHEADEIAMRRFFLSDSALNIRFFDLLALALVGSSETARPELVSNLWDESGRGNRDEAHVSTFRDLLSTRRLSQARADHAALLSAEGLAGHNLFMMTALNRVHANKLLGVMAVTELTDPASYSKVVRGCKRLGYTPQAYRYYAEHIEIDVVHGDGWLENVIAPALEQRPEGLADIVFGAQLRLASCKRYYDYQLSMLRSAAAPLGALPS